MRQLPSQAHCSNAVMDAIMDDDLGYRLTEAGLEIGRHHRLITELREGLEWALSFVEADHEWCPLLPDGVEKLDHYRKLLNRQVS